MYYRIINKRKRILTSLADRIGYALWNIGSILRNNKKESIPDKVREILIIRTAYVGDVIMTLPILRPLKEIYPEAKITFLTNAAAAEMLEGHPDIQKVLSYDAFWFYSANPGQAIKDYVRVLKALRRQNYDLVIEARADIRDIAFLMYASKSKCRVSYRTGGGGYLLSQTVPYLETKHRVEYHLDIVRFLGWRGKEIEWGVCPTQQAAKAANDILSSKGIGSSDFVVGIHPGGRKELKCWSGERYAEVADAIRKRCNGKIVFTGSSGERAMIEGIIVGMAGMAGTKNDAVNLAGETNLQVLASLVKRYDLFICNDSAPLHIASAMKTPTVAIFGPSKSRETGPYGNLHKVVEKNFPCRLECDESRCNFRNYNQCMRDISPADVVDAVSSLLNDIGHWRHPDSFQQ
jgi:lipopolysaccharide heptosyltransferase II